MSVGVERLAGMSLRDPARVDITTESNTRKATTRPFSSQAEVSREGEKFATPDTLKHHFVVVPNKLRLVTLAAFLLWKCKVCNTRCIIEHLRLPFIFFVV